ncbi:hypothetical protein N7461_004068 [Penicillium sp. DV-2018c]|nr:hypothetical protein N7461_004068 [Penicillium sp. DV-2018c]
MKAKAQEAAPQRLPGDTTGLASYQPPGIARMMPATSVISQRSALASPNLHEVREPRTPSNMMVYKAESLNEYDLFKAQQEAFWNRYPEWFHDDDRKVIRVTEFLSAEVNTTWMNYRKHNPGMEFTWSVFETWALAQVIDPVEMQREAELEWWMTIQAKHQDAHQYAMKLTSIYNRLKKTPDREHRLQRLRTGVLKEVRDEARRFPGPTTDKWDDWVAFYNRIEKSMPIRMSYLKDARKTTPTRTSGMPRPKRKARKRARMLPPGPNEAEAVRAKPVTSAISQVILRRNALVCNALVSDVKSGASTGVARTLIDSGATQSFVSQRWLKGNLEDMHAVSTRLIEAVNGRKIPSYGSRDIQLKLTDRNDTPRVMDITCEFVDMKVYDLILGMDWLTSVNPDIDWTAGEWAYRSNAPLEITILSPADLE